MRIAVLLDPLDSLKVYKDSTVAILRAAQGRGHALWVGMQDTLFARQHRVCGVFRPIELTDGEPWYRAGDAAATALTDFDVVLERKDPPFDGEYYTATLLLSQAEADGARILNRPAALRDFNEKLSIARFPRYTVPTLVARAGELIREFAREHGDIVVKPLDAMGGAEVFRVRPDDPNLSVILEVMTRHGARTIMAQRFVPEIRDGDKRILVIDGEPVPWCLARIPAQGETRGNLAAGGRGVARALTERDREIAEALGPPLRAAGIFLAGLDVIGDWLTEINVTSPTCFVEITQQTGYDVAGRFVEALEQKVRREG